MPDKYSQLLAKLNALATHDAVLRDGARVISTDGTPPPLDALLAEIDNIVLERTLVFCIDNAVLRVAAAGRRLRSVIDISGAPDSALAGQILSQDNPDMVQGVSTFLAQLCKNAAQVTVQILPATPIGNPSQAGIAVKTLMPPHDTPPADLLAFLTDATHAITDFVHIVDGQITDRLGQTDRLEAIWRNQWDAFHSRQKAILTQPDAPVLICLDHAFGRDRPAAIASLPSKIGIFAYDPAELGQILKTWQALAVRG